MKNFENTKQCGIFLSHFISQVSDLLNDFLECSLERFRMAVNLMGTVRKLEKTLRHQHCLQITSLN